MTLRCTCGQALRFSSRRSQRRYATEAAAESRSSADSEPAKILASALVSRPPLMLPALSPFEEAYYAYHRKIQAALAKPFDPTFYFRQGSAAEKTFVQADKTGEDPVPSAIHAARDERLARAEKQNERSLERQVTRTVYLLLKQGTTWRFPRGPVDTAASLREAALVKLETEAGLNMDVWPIAGVPVGVHSTGSDKTFFLPYRILRGQASKGDFAWLTREEIQQRVDESYWASVGDMLASV
ncbi:uncharacterized protein L969DRAFT_84859 [Mixia osmundae IAM 14324]|uniref:Large ribosomal subunit protein mL46 n=1 Tax=Mixia osmundae (strain CBS 9802 / IAM 14324 / JCM 22182 / KY 12970) TaxID=764103 RepID=G7DXR3_MIXOS|nr:uncharacterized protein L969DRAFT_84859 [Mixia osmundae IAM 14324]KEI41140.1 hypothetical protein L969DRAFT_84859 [Mixia osmundae IAM 14324]GAA95373.1 hypothetical protein E5Q_02027 [Mixia osmundae IAM 14324]